MDLTGFKRLSYHIQFHVNIAIKMENLSYLQFLKKMCLHYYGPAYNTIECNEVRLTQ